MPLVALLRLSYLVPIFRLQQAASQAEEQLQAVSHGRFGTARMRLIAGVLRHPGADSPYREWSQSSLGRMGGICRVTTN